MGSGVALALAAVAGVALQLQQARLWPWQAYAGLLAVALLVLPCLLVLLRRWQAGAQCWRGAGRGLLWLLVLLFFFAWPGLRACWFARDALPDALDGSDALVIGVVAAMPRLQPDAQRLRLAVESAQTRDGRPLRLPPRIELSWYAVPTAERFRQGPQALQDAQAMHAVRQQVRQALPQLQAGDRWRLPLRLRQPSGSLNPLAFDYERWLWEQGVQATAYVRVASPDDAAGGWTPQWLGDSGRFRLERYRQQVRDRIETYLDGHGDSSPWRRSAGVIAALVTGEQRAIDQQDWEVFRITGVAHLMAISGLHVTMFAWLAMQAVGWLWRRSGRLMLWVPLPVAAMWGGLTLAAAYAVFSGWGVPAQRTIWMLTAWVLLRSAGLRWPWHASLAAAAVVVLAIDPWALQQPGFWLSFVAVAVLLVLAGPADGRANATSEARAPNASHVPDASGATDGADAGGWRRSLALGSRRLRAGARQLWQLQWRLTLVLAPLTLALFGQVSVVGLLANLVAIPVVTLLVTPLAMLGVLLGPAWLVAAQLMQWLGGWLEWLAQWPLAAWRAPQIPWSLALLGAAGAVLLTVRVPLPWRVLGLPCLVVALLWRPVAPKEGEFRVLALDVGQGGAVLVQTHRHVLLYDAGPRYGAYGNAGERVIVPVMQAQGLRPDVLVLSHGDDDHVGGAWDVLRTFAGTEVLASFGADRLNRPASEGLSPPPWRSWMHCQAGQSWERDGVRFEFLHPPAWLLAQSEAAGPMPAQVLLGRPAPRVSTNSLSCVLRVSSRHGVTALLTGDIGRTEELDLWDLQRPALAAHWLLVPHHGSGGSSSRRFIDAVGARFAVAQAGHRNPFGHPAEAVAHRYGEAGSAFFATPQCGASEWQSAQPDGLLCERVRSRRYWHR
ncbi:ComEC family competence protein [Corticibacter populi]|uniref:ComEC family competence protein n=1 Tax=Corticibacter populi TaxID=1550736 RepID=A0A3M6R0L6_9BURK|nr:ComEC/Rec2 family competence protein [Corticibacter populi]RMX08429.1 ComEC family competence protein [Corticibacter populi]RZS35735.1 competence protein ComEC [Corticibacter populi]